MRTISRSPGTLAGFTLTLVVLCLFHSGLAVAQTQDPAKEPAKEPAKPTSEVEQLKQRLLQLEQVVTDLKGQINAIEEAKAKPSAPAVVNATYSEPVNAAPPDSPKPQNDNGKGESTFQIYGFAMLDAGYQFKQNHPDWFDVIRPTKLPAFEDEFAPDGKTYYGVRQSRLGVKATTPTKYGELKALFEFELFGTGVDAGQTTFRLRHAYGELGQFGAGQTWSPFMDIDVFPNSLEYCGPNGMVFFRNLQFRWMPLNGRNSVTLALERPGASADQGVFADRSAEAFVPVVIEECHHAPHRQGHALNWPARISSRCQLDTDINRRIVHVVLNALTKHKRKPAGVVRREFKVGRQVDAGADFRTVQVYTILDRVYPLDSPEHSCSLEVTPVAREANVSGEVRQIELRTNSLQLDAVRKHALVGACAGPF